MNTRTITSLTDLIALIRDMKRESGQTLWFRGEINSAWDLIASVKRPPYNGIDVEKRLTNEFYVMAKNRMERSPERDDYAGWLSLMQHYGLPTRLLDWSRSPLIAAFFATYGFENQPQDDACVWALYPSMLNRHFGYGEYIYPMDKDTIKDLLVPAFKDRPSTETMIACSSVENNLRMYVQQSKFTVHDCDLPLNELDLPGLLTKFVIPYACKATFAEELEICGFTLSDVFPDIERVASDLRKLAE